MALLKAPEQKRPAEAAETTSSPARPVSVPSLGLLHLQRTAGNRATAALVQRREILDNPVGDLFSPTILGPGDWHTSDRLAVDLTGPDAGNRFVTAAKYNTITGATAEYDNIAQRNTYYKAMQWLLTHDPALASSPAAGIRFFGAAATVTGYQGIGGLELPGAGIAIPPEVHRLAQLVNARLFSLNLGILRRVTLGNDLVDPRATLASPTSGFEFDLRMVETEQGEVETILRAHPLSPFGLWVMNQLVNTDVPHGGFRPTHMQWARDAMGVTDLDFTVKEHRMAIGRAMVYLAHGRTKADYMAFIASGASKYPSAPAPTPVGAGAP